MSSLAIALKKEPFTANVKVLNYKNERVIARLVEEHGMSREEAETLFMDTLRFLSLCGGDINVSPPARIDLGWHNFILHTRDYDNFCRSCFGHFIHHEPGSGLIDVGSRLNLSETIALAESVFGELSSNWSSPRGMTCGSMGC
jgi:hypothetical protein